MKYKFFPFPKINPELCLGKEAQTSINKMSFKFRLLSLFFYERVEIEDILYFKIKKNNKLKYSFLMNATNALVLYNNKDFKKFEKISLDIINRFKDKGWENNNFLKLVGYDKVDEFYSALDNIRGLSVLIRYYEIKPSKELLNKIEKVLSLFETLSSKGGVLSSEGYYLEYSCGDNSPVVWNGFMSALIGLHDCYLYGPEQVKKKAKKLFDNGLELLVKNQNKMFLKKTFFKWITYDTNKLYFAGRAYIGIEIKQLEYLSKIDKRLKESLIKMKLINKKYKRIAGLYEYYYFVKKRLMK